jgi:uncharacterized membrane protein YphA (DoxX/SURF4 family)
MLASYFVAAGIKAIRDPESLVPAAEPLVDRVVPLVKEYAPEQVAGYVPENTVTLVRVNGIAQVTGGLALATGKGRRLGALLLAGSLIPSTIAKHPFWKVQDPDERAQDRNHFLKNVSLLGGVLLAAQDTEGKPSLAWRARKGGETIAKETRKASKKLTKGTGNVAGEAGELAKPRWPPARPCLRPWATPLASCRNKPRDSWSMPKTSPPYRLRRPRKQRPRPPRSSRRRQKKRPRS